MGLPEIIFGTLGGVEIEQTAEQFPDAIHRKMIDPLYGVQPYEISDLLVSSVIPDRLWPQMNGIIQNLYKIYWETDSQLAEINPLVVTSSGELIAADGKMIIDDNALFRQKSLAEKRTMQSYEKTAEDAHINYIPLSGDIGMMGTGAGMAMANLDQVAHFGGNPANFMDVGPAINIHGVRAGMELLLSRADLKAILISGYTGSRLDIFAQDVVDALKDHPEFNIPIVIRLQGRNEEIGRKIFEENPFKNIYFCDDFDKAAELAVRLSRQVIV
jgi:succinyl-CoA synthetase beta subunit